MAGGVLGWNPGKAGKAPGALESEHRQRAGTKLGEEGPAEPRAAEAKEVVRGQEVAREVPRKNSVGQGGLQTLAET